MSEKIDKNVFVLSFSGFGVEFQKEKTPIAYAASLQTLIADDIRYLEEEFLKKVLEYKSAIKGLSDEFKSGWKLELSITVFNTLKETIKMDLFIFNGHEISNGNMSIVEKLEKLTKE